MLDAISGALSVAGGLFGNKGTSAKKMNQQAEIQYNWQRKLNQTAIQDKVRDAELAGIHPLYAISGQTNQGGISMPSQSDEPSSGERFSEMGQNISRAVASTGDRRQRALVEKGLELDLESKRLNNDLLRSQALASRRSLMGQAGQPPSMQDVIVNPDEVTAGNKGDPSRIAGDHAGMKNYKVGKLGRTIRLPAANSISESMEGMPMIYTYPKTGELLYKEYEHLTPGHWIANSKWFKKLRGKGGQ